MRFLTKERLLRLHRALLAQSGGLAGIRDTGSIDSALAQPQMTFGGEDLYPSIEEKAAAMGFSLIMNHPFLDGNKRIGHASMEAFLELNGYRIEAPIDEAEKLVLAIAAGEGTREQLVEWLKKRVRTVD